MRSRITKERSSTVLGMSARKISFLNQDDNERYTPINFKKVWWHPGSKERDKLRKAIRKELSDVVKRGIFRKTR